LNHTRIDASILTVQFPLASFLIIMATR